MQAERNRDKSRFRVMLFSRFPEPWELKSSRREQWISWESKSQYQRSTQLPVQSIRKFISIMISHSQPLCRHTFKYSPELTTSSAPTAGLSMRIWSASVEQMNHPKLKTHPSHAKISDRLSKFCLRR